MATRGWPPAPALLLPERVDPLLDTVLDDRYRIEAPLGEGGLGRVYLARHTRMSRRFAIKVLLGEHADDPTLRTRFAREAELAGRLCHPNVAGVTDVGQTPDGRLYLAMELAEGEPLYRLIDRGAIAPERAIAIAAQIAAGLDHAHRAGLVHRDLKPENVIVAADGTVRVIDFGIAAERDVDPRAARLTVAGTTIGTPQYMAPEQACGEPVDARADLFALGLVLYEMVAGRPPFVGSPLEVMWMNMSAAPPPIPGCDAALEALILALLAKQPDERPSTAAAVMARLRAIRVGAAPRRARIRMSALS